MSVLLPEGEVVISEALPVIGQLAALLFILGCLHVLDAFTRALFGTLTGAVGWIPYLGHVLRAPIHRIEQKISHSLGNAERGFDKRLGTSWHKLGQIARLIGRELEGTAHLLWAIAGVMAKLTDYKTVLRVIHAITHPIRTLQHIQARLLRIERHAVRALDHHIGHVVFPRVRALEHAIAGTLAHTIPGLRARDRAIADRLDRVWRWVRGHREVLTTGAFIGALVWALGRLGLAWVRCSNVKRVGRALCGFNPSLLEALLLDATLIVGSISIVEFGEQLLRVEDEIIRGIRAGFRELHNIPGA